MARPDNEVTREEFEAMLGPRRRQQPERGLQRRVLALARLGGWRSWHDEATNTPRRCPACGEVRRTPRNARGMLDLILFRRPRLIWVELKAEDGLVQPEQQVMIDELRACGQEVYLWRPSDWPEIERVLR